MKKLMMAAAMAAGIATAAEAARPDTEAEFRAVMDAALAATNAACAKQALRRGGAFDACRRWPAVCAEYDAALAAKGVCAELRCRRFLPLCTEVTVTRTGFATNAPLKYAAAKRLGCSY